ncbi:MAG: glycoside hydrolase family 127 protein [Candidatus Latescibacteria bacterium]|nr:glycoside hydrolase family 127 protein [Candidatus Latescibacterota bacterium]
MSTTRVSVTTVPPVFEKPQYARFSLDGVIGERVRACVDQWFLPTPDANPALVEMFRHRDRQPRQDLLPWSGEFVGKYLTAAVLHWRLTDDDRLRALIERLVRELGEVQDADGYLGPHPRSDRLTGKVVNGQGDLWDVWGHYHCMLGLLAWHEQTDDAAALAVCRRAADLVCRSFLDAGVKVSIAGAQEMNQAIIHAFCLLYERTGEPRYLEMARYIEQDWQTPPSGDYLRTALAGQPFSQTPKPRWESLHDLQAIAELSFITGDDSYRRAFEHIWWSILEGDRHNTGGFSSGEQATGNPYDPRAIETCCTVAWAALSVDMLRMTGLSTVADEIELSTFNGVLGGQSPTGRWWTYNTPMDGVRKASAHEIVFQARPGSPELNCCSVNGPRGLGMIGEWGVMITTGGLVVNYYGPGTVSVALPSGNAVELTQDTRYPLDGTVQVTVTPQQTESFVLELRIPHWSAVTTVAVNGSTVDGVQPGTYLSIDRTWKSGDRITLVLDLSLHCWVGERECADKVSLYRGPLLLAYDQRYNSIDPDDLPALRVAGLVGTPVAWNRPLPPWLLLRFAATDGRELTLCDFASAGMAGTPYRSWLPAEGLAPVPFSRTAPVWNVRPGSHA